MSETGKPLDHSYDGIQELDNPLPRWWLATFYGTIIFSALYFFYYHLGSGDSHLAELQKEMSRIEQARILNKPSGSKDLEKLSAYMQSAEKIASGKVVYTARCAACHATDGGGSIGPNLTDNFWIHGKGAPGDVLAVIASGVADKGMPPWSGALTPEELYTVAAFTLSLHGKTPATPKAPQGTEVAN